MSEIDTSSAALIDAMAAAIDPANYYMAAENYGGGRDAADQAAAINDLARKKARAALAAIRSTGYAVGPAIAAGKEAAGDAATLATMRARLLEAETERDQAIDRAKKAERDRDFWKGYKNDETYRAAAEEERRMDVQDELEQAENTIKHKILEIDNCRERLRTLREEFAKVKSEQDSALRLLADQTGPSVSGRDFTTVATTVLAARHSCDPADPCPVAQDLTSENRTLDFLLAEAKERAKDAEARGERMRAALQEADEVFGMAEKPASEDPHYGAAVRALGGRMGYGALMSSASAAWRSLPGVKGGEFVVGPCHSTVLATLRLIRAALAEQEADCG